MLEENVEVILIQNYDVPSLRIATAGKALDLFW